MNILWRGEIVGQLVDAVPDMHYLDGRFIQSAGESGERFASTASALNAKDAYKDPSKGIRALLKESNEGPATVVVVMSLAEERLFLRRVFDDDAIRWVNENVRE